MGTVGVEVIVGGGVLDGMGVCVGVSVDNGCVAEGVSTASVGVSVFGTLDGRLQADMARTTVIASINNELRGFIASLL